MATKNELVSNTDLSIREIYYRQVVRQNFLDQIIKKGLTDSSLNPETVVTLASGLGAFFNHHFPNGIPMEISIPTGLTAVVGGAQIIGTIQANKLARVQSTLAIYTAHKDNIIDTVTCARKVHELGEDPQAITRILKRHENQYAHVRKQVKGQYYDLTKTGNRYWSDQSPVDYIIGKPGKLGLIDPYGMPVLLPEPYTVPRLNTIRERKTSRPKKIASTSSENKGRFASITSSKNQKNYFEEVVCEQPSIGVRSSERKVFVGQEAPSYTFTPYKSPFNETLPYLFLNLFLWLGLCFSGMLVWNRVINGRWVSEEKFALLKILSLYKKGELTHSQAVLLLIRDQGFNSMDAAFFLESFPELTGSVLEASFETASSKKIDLKENPKPNKNGEVFYSEEQLKKKTDEIF